MALNERVSSNRERGPGSMLIHSAPIERTSSPLFAPKSQLLLMQRLAERDLVRAAMDNSDGLLPSLQEIAQKNNCIVDLDIEELSRYNPSQDDDLVRCWMGWGDWNGVRPACRLRR